ncbi:hypothetical protein VKT23_012862 [Stygiomarasmius scandens]|uniref:Uncharacterized protein n=1 Tax=Marasmiellus scandens TaxID=2682957 RepID=A0ABR1J776_9AGAR
MNPEKSALGIQDEPPSYDDTLAQSKPQTEKKLSRDAKAAVPTTSTGIASSTTSYKGKGKAAPTSKSWWPFSTKDARQSQTHRIQTRAIVLGLIRDLVRSQSQKTYTDGTIEDILDSCADACESIGLSFSQLLQEKYIGGHTPIY